MAGVPVAGFGVGVDSADGVVAVDGAVGVVAVEAGLLVWLDRDAAKQLMCRSIKTVMIMKMIPVFLSMSASLSFFWSGFPPEVNVSAICLAAGGKNFHFPTHITKMACIACSVANNIIHYMPNIWLVSSGMLVGAGC